MTGVAVKDHPATRQFDATVAKDGRGDYESIAEAFAEGNRTVFVKNGTYVETSDIVMPSGGVLQGETAGETLIYFAGTASQIKADAGAAKETAGTVSVPNGSTTVTGVGTSFTSLPDPSTNYVFIRLHAAYHLVASITDDTHLELQSTFRGRAISGIAYEARGMFAGLTISSLIVVGGLGVGIYLRGIQHAVLEKIVSKKHGSHGLELVDCTAAFLLGGGAEDVGGVGVKLTSCTMIELQAGYAQNSVSHGFQLTGCEKCIFAECVAVQNGGDGLMVDGATEATNVTDSQFCDNNGKGANTEPGTKATLIASGMICRNGGDGIDYDGQYNLVEGCLIGENGGVGIQGGDDGVLANNQVIGNTGVGIQCGNDPDCVIEGNRVENNRGHGIVADDRSVVSNNKVKNNSAAGKGIDLSGATNCTCVGNVVSGHTTEISVGTGNDVAHNITL